MALEQRPGVAAREPGWRGGRLGRRAQQGPGCPRLGFLPGRPRAASPQIPRQLNPDEGCSRGPECSNTGEAGRPDSRRSRAGSQFSSPGNTTGKAAPCPEPASPSLQAPGPSGSESCLPCPPRTVCHLGRLSVAELRREHRLHTSVAGSSPARRSAAACFNQQFGTASPWGAVPPLPAGRLVKTVPASWQARRGPGARGSLTFNSTTF